MPTRIRAQSPRGTVEFDLDESGWVKKYREYLNDGVISLLASDGSAPLSVNTRGRRWVLFMRTLGQWPGGTVRLLCLGWQDTVEGKNVKALLWIYPDGSVELSEEPTKWKKYI